MQNLAFKCWTKAQIAKQQAKEGIKNFFSEETGAEGLIVAIILIVIVIAIAIIFREQIFEWVENLFNAANEDMDGTDWKRNPEV